MRQLLAVCALVLATSAHAAVPQSQRDALIAIYNATGGPSWTNSTGWNGAPGTECSWFGVGCDEGQANVVGLELYQNNLRGTLPAAIRNLPKLRSMQIYGNQIGGAVPSELSELAELEALYADNNLFEGTVPKSLGAMKKLQILQFNGNQLDGPLPAELGDMIALEQLGLSYNRITGGIPPELGKLTNLRELNLAANQLTGSIPAALGTLANLNFLHLGSNELTGPLPPQLGDLDALTYFSVAVNRLDGPLPAALGTMNALESLFLDRNDFTGTIPTALGDIVTLRELALDANEFEGELPDAFFNLVNLEHFTAGENHLRGPLPARIGNLKKLRYFSLYGNDFTGSIPLELTTLAALEAFELSSNEFEGPLPAELARLTKLDRLSLYDNHFSGAIPPELGTLSALRILLLNDNDFEGPIPPELGQLTNLEQVYLDRNALTGAIPDTLRNLKKVQQFGVSGNRISGNLPSWIGELTSLTDFFANANLLTGTIPAGVAELRNLAYFAVGDNQLTGSLPDFTKLTELQYIDVEFNRLTGSLPTSIGVLTKLREAYLAHNAFTGPLPKEIGNWTSAEYVAFSNNSIEGALPKELAGLQKAYAISLYGNRFTGTIPRELGQLTNLQYLDLSFNALRGPIPAELANLTNLIDRSSDFSYNALFADSATLAFINTKHYDGDLEATQTLTPTNIEVVQTTDRNVTMRWTPIEFHYNPGGYQVVASTTPGGPAVAIATTSGKDLDSITVRNLAPLTTYFLTVATVTHPHDQQENLVVSDASAPRQITTGPRVIAPPDVVLTEAPEGMVQIDGQRAVDDQFTLTNFGDVATTIALERGGEFFTVEPVQFSLAAGASQVVQVRSLAQPVGSYYGHVVVRGVGAADDLIAYVVLLSVARPAGTVVAEALATTIELAGAPGSDSVGVVQFRNTGTARLSGIMVSDQPWVVTATAPITIDPGQVGSVNFRVDRTKRRGGTDGALVANLSLVYVDGNSASLLRRGMVDQATTGVSVTKVTVVDTTKPPVTTGSIPAVSGGELPLIVAGLVNRGSLRSDISLVNSSAGRGLDNLKLYFTSGGLTSIASLQPLGASEAVNLINIVGNVYGGTNSIGTLQVRSGQPQNAGVEAKATAVTPAGTLGGSLPVFRSDRVVTPAAPIYLTGLARPGDLIVQELTGVAANVRVTFLDASGQTVSSATHVVAPSTLLELQNAIPANAVSAIVRNEGGGAFVAYARITDATSGDTWSVVDWSAFYRYERDAAVRVPFADGFTSSGGTKRRAVRPLATTPRAATDVTLFNPSETVEARARLQIIESSGHVAAEREITIAPRSTIVQRNAALGATTSTAHLVVTPLRGEVVASARSSAGVIGTAIPVLAATSGLRLGQLQLFSGLDDSTSATVSAGTPSTFRTGYGLVETAGASARVRARLVVSETTALVSAVVSRTFDLAPRQQVWLPEVLRSFAGDARDTAFGDLFDLTLELEVIGGAGAVVPFVIETDNGTGDSALRMQ